MDYKSTRNCKCVVSASKAISQGISAEGGLFVPESFPEIGYSALSEMKNQSYVERAEKILSLFLTDFTSEEIKDCVTSAYTAEKFGSEVIAPLVALEKDDTKVHILELWHGPTCAFKDMALQILPHLLTKSMKKTCDGQTVVILVATSGDTGKAALEGFKDIDGTKILVFYPEDGVSPMQKLQMNTQEGENVSVCAIKGNFDDAQTGVKKIFTDESTNKILEQNQMQFSSANSINWGRLLPQIVYYFSAYCDLMKDGTLKNEGEKINIVVPTGNFGNILAAYYAMQMGLPINRLICASNSNNVLTDFIKTGTYDRNRSFYTTISPSMDILISSNLERLLFDMAEQDDEKLSIWMNQLSNDGKYTVSDEVKEKMTSLFYGGCCDDVLTKETIKSVFDKTGYLCDTHTAVAVKVYEQYVEKTQDKTPAIIASTASPYKFADSVLEAVSDGSEENLNDFEKLQKLSSISNTEIPQPISELSNKQVRFSQVCTDDTMKNVVLEMLGI